LPVVKAAPAKLSATMPALVKPAPKKVSPPAIQKAPAVVKAARPRGDDDEAGDKQEKSGATTWLLMGGGIVGGGVILLVLLAVIVGLVIWGVNRNKNSAAPDTSQASRPDPTPDRHPDPPKDPKPDPGDGSLPADVLSRTKQATVYISVKSGDGHEGSGSGFFEQSSGLIVTNAHVVGMLRADAKPPTKIEVVLNGGSPNEISLPATLVTVDRASDLAMLDVQLAPLQAQSQAKLTVLPAKDLLETQRVYVFGFPYGKDVNRAVTVSNTSVSSLHKGADGVLTQVQVNGGMHPGNSGGPVVDPRGNVIGVAVRGIEGTLINFAIPGEQVQALLGGRVTAVVVDTDAVARDRKFYIKVEVRTLDPRKAITRLAVDYWTGPGSQTPPKPSDQQPPLAPGNSQRQTTNMVYDPAKQAWVGELALDAAPDGTNQLWLQTVTTSGAGRPAWGKGFAFAIAPPVEPRAVVLKAQQRLGAVPVQVNSSGRYKLSAPGREDLSLLMNIVTRLNEDTQRLLPAGGAQLRDSVQRFEIGLSLNDEKVDTTDEFQQAIRQDVGAMALEFLADGQGSLTAKKVSFIKPVAPKSREILTDIGKQLLQSFDMVSTPQQGNLVQPGQTWQAKRELPTPILADAARPAMMDVTFTYRGVRPFKGHQVAVVSLRGTVAEPNQSGQLTGTILIAPETGTVVQATAKVESVMPTLVRGRCGANIQAQATGTLEINLKRGYGID
jgi:S1-C subfamily serine protease